MNNLKNNTNISSDEYVNNFFLTRIKLSLVEYLHIIFIQFCFFVSAKIDIFIFVFIFYYLVLTILKKNIKYFGIIYISIPFFCFAYFQNIGELLFYLILILTITIPSDVGGFIFGKIIKGPKIFFRVSPKKTWSGFLGGILLSILSSMVVFSHSKIDYNFFTLVFFLSVVSQLGDFIESYYKRLCKVKESGTMIPGHGGILDRIDGALLLTTVIFILNIINLNFKEFFVF